MISYSHAPGCFVNTAEKTDAGRGFMKHIAHLTDLHLDDPMVLRFGVDPRANLMRVLSDLNARGIHDIELTGDLGESTALDWLFEQLDAYAVKPNIVLGNHDNPGEYSSRSSLIPYFHGDALYYSNEEEGFLQLHLDSGKGMLDPAQRDWLIGLSKNAQRPLLIWMHHPVMDCGNTPMDRLFPLMARDEIRDLLDETGLPVHLFCGHYHAAHTVQKSAMTQYVTVSSCAQLKKTGDMIQMDGTNFGYRLVTLDNGHVQTEIVLLNPS